jgi:subtilase family serine protease
MRKYLLLAGVSALAVVAAWSLPAPVAAATPRVSPNVHVCAAAPAGSAACLAELRAGATAVAASALVHAAPAGYGPSSLISAYNLPSATAGTGQTVAIVDAMNDPTAEHDLGVYRAQFGIAACTTANGCFKKVNQNGSTTGLPPTDAGWALEISLDIEMVSAICPKCKILLVEANTATLADLGTAVDRAVTMGAKQVSNSYGGSESGTSGSASHWTHSGVAVTASTGDGGFGVSFPSSAPAVIAVGGTTLTKASNSRGWTETAWSGAGSGCSAVFARPAVQAAVNTGCARRAVADVAAVADPNTGVAVYDSTPLNGQSGWFVVGGTSVSSPVIASVFALVGNTATNSEAFPYGHTSALYDITSGSNGSCSPSQLCHARVGWDGPTGLGTPHGTGAF